MTLHLAAVILFQKFTQNIIHIPGKCVPQILVFLKDHLDGDNYLELVKLQGELGFYEMSLCMRKQTIWVSDHVLRKLACTITEG